MHNAQRTMHEVVRGGVSRRQFIRDGVGAAAIGLTVPALLVNAARVQGAGNRTLVVLYLAGGNDSLSMLIPYNDAFYYSRRPTIAVPAAQVLQVGTDSGRTALGLHPRLTGLRSLYDQGRLALVQRVGYENQSRSHFYGSDLWSTANILSAVGPGWLGRYLDRLPKPVDPLTAWCTVGGVPHVLQADTAPVATIPAVSSYTYQSPNSGSEATLERTTASAIATNAAPGRPHLAFVNESIRSAVATLDRVAAVNAYAPSVTYPTSALGQALRTVAGAMAKGVGTRIFFVQFGGFDNHSSEGTTATTGTYYGLMATLNDAVAAFAADLQNTGLFNDTLVLQFSEFGRRIAENGSAGTDHGAAAVMMALGGGVRGGIFGTAPSLNPDPQNPTLENSGNDVHYETDFRSVYARVLDQWMGIDSASLLGGNYRKAGLEFV
jgi:uncharacterized protein (DUF1501 family)